MEIQVITKMSLLFLALFVSQEKFEKDTFDGFDIFAVTVNVLSSYMLVFDSKSSGSILGIVVVTFNMFDSVNSSVLIFIFEFCLSFANPSLLLFSLTVKVSELLAGTEKE